MDCLVEQDTQNAYVERQQGDFIDLTEPELERQTVLKKSSRHRFNRRRNVSAHNMSMQSKYVCLSHLAYQAIVSPTSFFDTVNNDASDDDDESDNDDNITAINMGSSPQNDDIFAHGDC